MSWFALALALTVAGGIWTWYAARNRGMPSAIRGVALTLLAPAAYLTGTLEMLGDVTGAVARWAAGFVFSPFVWLGISLAGLSAVLFVVSGWLGSRQGDGPQPEEPKRRKKSADPGRLPPSSGKGEPVLDDDLADIEAILKRRGIS